MNELVISNFLIIPNQIADRFSEGGPFFMSLILICLLLSIFLLIKGFINLKKDKAVVEKMLKLAVDASLLALVLGFLASVIGLITAFDSVESMGDPDPAIFAGGLKVSLLTATFGLFSFIIARIGILVLRWCSKANDNK